jgi:RNA-directed DNA polymerase
MRGVRAKIRQQTERCRLRVARAELVQGLNRVIRGWRNYCRVGNSTTTLADLDRYVRLRLWIFLRKRQGPRGHLRPEGYAAWLWRSGLERFYPTGRGHVPPGLP